MILSNISHVISYKTVKKECSAELVEKKSVFICTVKSVHTENEALNFIGEIRQKYKDASHNVYAYIIKDTNAVRFSDDGEPSSTAGVPCLTVLQKHELTNVAAVVTRYFGGILLGAGGLVRAYSHATKLGVDAAGIALYENFTEFDLICGYADYEKILNYIKNIQVITDDTNFEENVIMSMAIKYDEYDKFAGDITNLTNGKAKFNKKGFRYTCF